jgi:hypothetical protein
LPKEVKVMTNIDWVFSMTGVDTVIVSVIVVAAIMYTFSISKENTPTHHSVDKMAGDEGED